MQPDQENFSVSTVTQSGFSGRGLTHIPGNYSWFRTPLELVFHLSSLWKSGGEERRGVGGGSTWTHSLRHTCSSMEGQNKKKSRKYWVAEPEKVNIAIYVVSNYSRFIFSCTLYCKYYCCANAAIEFDLSKHRRNRSISGVAFIESRLIPRNKGWILSKKSWLSAEEGA